MKVTKTAMREEALKRMEMLGLDESVIEDFRKRKRVLVSDQQFVDFDPDSSGSHEITTSFPNFVSVNGRMYQMFTAAPSEERLQLIKELENQMKVLVYHVIRIETDLDNDNDNHAIYVFLTIWRFQEDWESERETITDFSTVYGHQTLYGYPQTVNYLEYGEIPFKPYMGCLVVTNVR